MDNSNSKAVAAFLAGAMLGAFAAAVSLVPEAFALGKREGTAQGRADGDQPDPEHSPITLIGGPADGTEVILPPGPCSTVGLRFLVMVTRQNHLDRYTYTIVEPHLARHTPEEGDSE